MQTIPSTISGITFSQAKRIAKSSFFDDIILIQQNIESSTYDIFVNEKVIERNKAKMFFEAWNNAFRIIPIKIGEPIKQNQLNIIYK